MKNGGEQNGRGVKWRKMKYKNKEKNKTFKKFKF